MVGADGVKRIEEVFGWSKATVGLLRNVDAWRGEGA
jgi:hypothetical protein